MFLTIKKSNVLVLLVLIVVAKNSVFLDTFLPPVVGDKSAIQLLTGLSGVYGALVGCLGNEERRTVALPTCLHGAVTQASKVEPATGRHPTQTTHIADENFIVLDVDFVVPVPKNAPFLEDVRCLSELKTTFMIGSADVQVPGFFLTNQDSAARNSFSVSKDPNGGVVGPDPVVFLRACFSFADPVALGPSMALSFLLMFFVFLVREKTACEKGSASNETAANLELFSVLWILVPSVIALLALLGLRWLLVVLRGLLLRLLLLLLIMLLFFVTIVVVIVAHASPESSGSLARSPIGLGSMRLDDLPSVAFILDNIAIVVLSTRFPALSVHIV